MLVYKKLNNNVAVCKDGNNKDVVVFARGIGFRESNILNQIGFRINF